MAYSDNFPAVRPVFQADFANGGKIDPRATFSRASTANVFDGSKHESSQNLVLQSQNFGTTWAASSHTASNSASSGTGPDGSDSWLMTAKSTGNDGASVNQSFSFKASTQYTYSVFVKAGTATHAWFAARGDSSNSVTGTLNFSSPGSLATTAQGWTLNSSSVSAYGSWYRVSLTFTTNSSVSSPYVFVGTSDGTVPASYYPIYTPSGETLHIWGAQIEERGSATAYNATTTQIHREYAPTLVSKANNAARFETATDGQSMGCLIESSVANVMAYSRNGFNASNSFQYTLHSGVTATENAAVGPSGSLDATLLSEDSTTGAHQLQTTETVTSAAHTVSVYVKPVGAPSFGIRISSGTVYGSVFTFADESFTNYGTAPEVSRIESVGGGWYRLSITQTVTSGSSLIRFNLFDSGGNASYAGTGYNGILLFGFQCEANSWPSSWVDTGTSGSTATRASDQLSVATADIGYTGGPMTLVTDTAVSDPTSSNYHAAAYVFLDSSNSAGIWATSADNRIARVETGGVGGNVGTNSGVNGKAALSIDTNDIAVCLNGGAVATDTSHALADFGSATLFIGNNNSAYHLDGHVKRLALYNEALSDTNLQSLTAS